MSQVPPRTATAERMLLGGIAACLCLAVVLWFATGPSAPGGGDEAFDVALPDVNGIAPGADASYPMMLEQPLFWPERAPGSGAAASGAAAAGPGGPEGLVYLGVIVKGSARQALFRDGQSVHVLHEGETIRDLKVRHIGVDGVTLGDGASEVKLPAPVDNTGSIAIRPWK